MQQSSSQIRFKLTLKKIPDETAAEKICELIYGQVDRTLIASILSTPYTVGRSFDEASLLSLTDQLKPYGLSFECKSLPPHDVEYSYDPDLEPIAPDTSPPSAPSRPFQKRALLAGAVSFSIVALGIAFFIFQDSPVELKSEIAAEDRVPENPVVAPSFDAVLDRLVRRVEFRKSNDLLWSKATAGTGLNINDAVRTYDNSRAILKYTMGPRISIRENSLVVVGKVRKEAEIYSEAELALEEGGLQARMPASQRGQVLEINTPPGKASN
jgi:hypothetical protein